MHLEGNLTLLSDLRLLISAKYPCKYSSQPKKKIIKKSIWCCSWQQKRNYVSYVNNNVIREKTRWTIMSGSWTIMSGCPLFIDQHNLSNVEVCSLFYNYDITFKMVKIKSIIHIVFYDSNLPKYLFYLFLLIILHNIWSLKTFKLHKPYNINFTQTNQNNQNINKP